MQVKQQDKEILASTANFKEIATRPLSCFLNNGADEERTYVVALARPCLVSLVPLIEDLL
ncbi:hypothetical protein BLX87_06425 [Bacillus sp. VT-16-64]|nr:hypothetical protein BLX87_06425 [Bacillus sp. VT-16-64]